MSRATACAASTKRPTPSSAPSRSLLKSRSRISSSANFSTRFPANCREVTIAFARYEAANPASADRIPAACEGAQRAVHRAGDCPETAREGDLASTPRDPAAHFELGVVFDRSRNYADAAREFEKAAELDPSIRRRTTASLVSTTAWARPMPRNATGDAKLSQRTSCQVAPR